MSGLERFLELLVAGVRRLIRDVVCPVAGLFLVYQLGRGQFATGAVPFIATLASALIGLPVWLKSDERRRESGDSPDERAERKKRRKRITIDFGGDDEDEDASR